VVFTVGDPFPNLMGGLTEYLFWCADHDQILQERVLLSLLKKAVDFGFQ